MIRVQSGQRIGLHELRGSGCVTPHVDAAPVPAIQTSPRRQGNLFGQRDLGVLAGPDQPVLNQLFAVFLVGIRIDIRFRIVAQQDFQQFAGRVGHVNRPAVTVRRQLGQAPAVIEVGVRDNHGVELVHVEWKRFRVTFLILAAALQQAATEPLSAGGGKDAPAWDVRRSRRRVS